MFELDWEKLLLIAVVAIVVIGPKDLPRALRVVGQWVGRARRMGREFPNQFTEAIREAELDTVQRDIEEIGKIDPMADIREAAAKAGGEIEQGLKRSPDTTQPAAPAVTPEATLATPDPSQPTVTPTPETTPTPGTPLTAVTPTPARPLTPATSPTPGRPVPVMAEADPAVPAAPELGVADAKP